MAEPVLDFQLPDMEVLLKRVKHKLAPPFQRIRTLLQNLSLHVHVGFVVGADLLDSDVVFGVDERFCGRVRLGQSHHAGYVLELHVVIHLHLDAEENLCEHHSARRAQRGRSIFIPFQRRSGRVQSSRPQETTACSPNVRKQGFGFFPLRSSLQTRGKYLLNQL